MNLAISPLFTPLLALDRLNSWLRSDQPWCCPIRSALKPVVYWTKTNAILDISKQWQIGLRRVMVKKPCRRCDGTGTWISDYAWDWKLSRDEMRANYGERCRGCEGTGTATLKFIETTIGLVRWHTPADKWYMSSLDLYLPYPSFYAQRDSDQYYEDAGTWQPEQKGRPLTPSEIERDILLVLRAYPHHVAFALDFHHHAGTEPRYGCPDIPKAQAWLRNLFRAEEIRTELRKLINQ